MNLKEIVLHRVYSGSLDNIPKTEKCVINTINPHSYYVAKKDNEFEEALLQSSVLLPDGSGIVLAAKVLKGKKIIKIAGANLHHFLLKSANEQGQKVFYLGAAQNTLNLINKRIKNEFPNIRVEFFSPPFKVNFSNDDTLEMLERINAFQPNILFVGMTAPKQEKWVFRNKDKIDAQIIASIGAVFDFYAGTVKRSGSIWIKLGLEWLPRLIRDPKRLWRRNFISTPIFLIDLIKEKLNVKV